MLEETHEEPLDAQTVTPEQAERWRRAAAELAAPHANHTQGADPETDLEARRSAFARVMSEALGSLLLRGGDEELDSLDRWADKK